jgi:hypothetical protein
MSNGRRSRTKVRVPPDPWVLWHAAVAATEKPMSCVAHADIMKSKAPMRKCLSVQSCDGEHPNTNSFSARAKMCSHEPAMEVKNGKSLFRAPNLGSVRCVQLCLGFHLPVP